MLNSNLDLDFYVFVYTILIGSFLFISLILRVTSIRDHWVRASANNVLLATVVIFMVARICHFFLISAKETGRFVVELWIPLALLVPLVIVIIVFILYHCKPILF